LKKDAKEAATSMWEVVARRAAIRFVLWALLMVFSTSALHAHESRPAYLEVKQTTTGQYSLLWRTPLLSGMRLAVTPEFPRDVRQLKTPVSQETIDSVVTRYWIEAGPSGLAGKRIEFPGLQGTITDVLVRVELLDGRSWTAIVHPLQPWVEITAAQTGGSRCYFHRSGHSPHSLPCGPYPVRPRLAVDREESVDVAKDDHGLHGRP
jgi:hypothetical protein